MKVSRIDLEEADAEEICILEKEAHLKWLYS